MAEKSWAKKSIVKRKRPSWHAVAMSNEWNVGPTAFFPYKATARLYGRWMALQWINENADTARIFEWMKRTHPSQFIRDRVEWDLYQQSFLFFSSSLGSSRVPVADIWHAWKLSNEKHPLAISSSRCCCCCMFYLFIMPSLSIWPLENQKSLCRRRCAQCGGGKLDRSAIINFGLGGVLIAGESTVGTTQDDFSSFWHLSEKKEGEMKQKN